MNRKVLVLALAGMMMLPTMGVAAMPQVQQSKEAENAKGTQFFKGTFAQALAKAKKENKKLMVDCYTLWCGPCHAMSQNIFPNDTLGAYLNERFVCFKLDMEHGEGPELNKTIKVRSYPTFVVFDANGKEMNRFTGYSNKDKFMARCEKVLNGQNPEDLESEKKEDAVVKQTVKKEVDTDDAIRDEGKGVKFIEATDVPFTEILAQAKRENKRILVDVWADWCGACKRMDSTVFKDTRIGNLMNYSLINYSYNFEKVADGKAFLNKYNIHSFPTYLILNPDATEFNRITGSRNAVGLFSSELTNVLMGNLDSNALQEKQMKEMMKQMRLQRQAQLRDQSIVAPKTKVKFVSTADLATVKKMAKKQGKRIMVYASTGEWPCDYMTNYTFNETEAADYLNKNYVCVFLDVMSRQGDTLCNQLSDNEIFPQIILFDKDGDKKGVYPGIIKTGKSLKDTLERYYKNVK